MTLWIFTLGRDGSLLSSHQPDISGDASSGEVLAVHSSGVTMTCGVKLTRFDPDVWCGLIDPNGVARDISHMVTEGRSRRVSSLIP